MVPSKILGDKEAQELVQFNYSSSCLLGVNSYRGAMSKLSEEDEAVQSQWMIFKENH